MSLCQFTMVLCGGANSVDLPFVLPFGKGEVTNSVIDFGICLVCRRNVIKSDSERTHRSRTKNLEFLQKLFCK